MDGEKSYHSKFVKHISNNLDKKETYVKQNIFSFVKDKQRKIRKTKHFFHLYK